MVQMSRAGWPGINTLCNHPHYDDCDDWWWYDEYAEYNDYYDYDEYDEHDYYDDYDDNYDYADNDVMFFMIIPRH